MWYRLKILMFLSFLPLILVQCEHSPTSFQVRELTPLEKRLVDSGNQFGWNLFKKLAAEKKDKNVFISPLSVSLALGMTLNGADGETRTAMEQTLGVAGMSPTEINESYQSLMHFLLSLDQQVDFRIANSIWYREGLPVVQEFVQINQRYFNALVQALNFADSQALQIISNWIKEATNGRIDKMIDHIESGTVMFLVNAIYFKGIWSNQFDPKNTKDDFFKLPDGTQESIKMMHLTDNLLYAENEMAQIVELPYGNGLFSMVVVLPQPEISLDSLISHLDPQIWQSWIATLQEKHINLFLPKFKITYKDTLNEVLKALGMAVAFQAGRANFRKMIESSFDGNLYISKVLHNTFVQVDEEGTEAAAVTVVQMGTTAVPKVVMRVDRPFLFAIRERHSGTIIFVGQILDINS